MESQLTEKEETGRAEAVVASSCHYCKKALSKRLIPLSTARLLFAEHLKAKHPALEPRPRSEIIREYEARKSRESKKKEKDREKAKRAARKARPIVSRPKKRTPVRLRVSQPKFTDEMLERAKELYEGIGSLQGLASQHHREFGFTSVKAFKRALSRNFREKGVPLAPNASRSFLTEEMASEAIRLSAEEQWSVREIARTHHVGWGYTENGLRNRLYRLFDEKGVDYRQVPRKKAQKYSVRNNITPERLKVVWHLYSAGNYYLREITDMASGVWGHLGHNSLGQALRHAGYKTCSNKWENDGSRPIGKREALKLIKSVK